MTKQRKGGFLGQVEKNYLNAINEERADTGVGSQMSMHPKESSRKKSLRPLKVSAKKSYFDRMLEKEN